MENESIKQTRSFGKNGVPTPISPGRPAGVPNKATQRGREAIARFVDENAHRLAEWLDAIAEDSPKDAFNAFQSVIEYHIPKLARTENLNKTEISIEITEADKAVIDARRQKMLYEVRKQIEEEKENANV